jgi:hypothetical protein
MNLTVSKTRVAFALTGIGLAVSSIAFAFVRSPLNHNHRAPVPAARTEMPRLVLWAWERPSDLSFINPNEVGVAFLARTLTLSGEEVRVRPRLQSLKVPEGTSLTAVARIEIDRFKPATLSESQLEVLTAKLREMAAAPGIVGVQIDFDAKQSEREFYTRLITEVRRELPPNMTLSVTALASWCIGDRWLSDLPVDDAVPMLFRLGPDANPIRSGLAMQMEFSEEKCRNSYGVSTDEPVAGLRPNRRLFVFSPQKWTRDSLETFLSQRNYDE